MTNNNAISADISIIKEVVQLIASTHNIDSMSHLILDFALEYTQAERGSVLILDEEGNLTVRAARGIAKELLPVLKIKQGEHISGEVFKDKTPLLIKDVKRAKIMRRKERRGYKTGSFICCPVLAGKNAYGVINITDKASGKPFTENDFAMINVLANQLALSLEHVHVLSELRSRNFQLDEGKDTLIHCNKARAELIGHITHGLRTPLNAISGAVYYLKEKKVSKHEKANLLGIISESTDNLIEMFNDLLNTPLTEESALIKKKPLNPVDTIIETTSSSIIRDLLLRHRIMLSVKLPEFLPDIAGRRNHLIQTLVYIIEGITACSYPGDRIELAAKHTAVSVKINFLLKDRKFPEEDLPFIFDDYSIWTEKELRRNKLSFYLARKNMEREGGAISVSNSRRGIVVQLVFPQRTGEYIDTEINAAADLFLDLSAGSLNLNRCSFMFVDKQTSELKIRSSIGINDEAVRHTSMKPGEGIAGRAVLENQPMLVDNIEKDPRFRRKNRNRYSTGSFICIPVRINGGASGIINLNDKENRKAFDRKDLCLAGIFADRFSLIINRIMSGELRDRQFHAKISGLASLVDAKKNYTKKGIISDIVFNIASELGCSEHETGLALYAVEFYDLGLSQIDERILQKPGALSPAEWHIIRIHPFSGAGLIRHIEPDDTVSNGILHHHERHDGTGYPDGLKGDRIPFISKVIAVADAYSALVSGRPYKKPLGRKKALSEIRSHAGTQFDPEIVDAFARTV